jgi:cytochrome d ubiquinol oxidase subunit II
MSVVAFCVLGVLLGGYVLLDGYDLGMASILLFVARSGDERQSARNAIAPFWNGNEVFLVAAGAALFALFPLVYASSFSGFYLPFMVALWLLMGRGIAFEIREMIESPLWHAFWDVAFSLSSLVLIVLFGVALGNIVRGVPLEQSGYFLGLCASMVRHTYSRVRAVPSRSAAVPPHCGCSPWSRFGGLWSVPARFSCARRRRSVPRRRAA